MTLTAPYWPVCWHLIDVVAESSRREVRSCKARPFLSTPAPWRAFCSNQAFINDAGRRATSLGGREQSKSGNPAVRCGGPPTGVQREILLCTLYTCSAFQTLRGRAWSSGHQDTLAVEAASGTPLMQLNVIRLEHVACLPSLLAHPRTGGQFASTLRCDSRE